MWADYEEIFHPDSSPRPVPWAQIFDASLPLLEVGPGRGITTVAWAKAMPEAHIIAVEPDAAFRRQLANRISAAGVGNQIEVLPVGIEDAVLPPQLGGVGMFGVLYWLSRQSRSELWPQLARHLPSGRMTVTETGNGPAVANKSLGMVKEVEHHGQRFERWVEGIATAADTGILRNVVNVFDGDELMSSDVHDTPFYAFTQEDREAEIVASAQFDVVHISAEDGASDFTCARRR